VAGRGLSAYLKWTETEPAQIVHVASGVIEEMVLTALVDWKHQLLQHAENHQVIHRPILSLD
jgi:hypothetical protein